MSTDISLLEEHPEPQRQLVRTLVIYLPLAMLSVIPLWLSLNSLLSGQWGALLPLTIMLLLTFSLSYQSYCAYRDLNATHEETRGSIRRIWSKGAVLWLFRSHYILVGRVLPPPPCSNRFAYVKTKPKDGEPEGSGFILQNLLPQ